MVKPDESTIRQREIRVPFPFSKIVASMQSGKTYYRWKAGCRWEEIETRYASEREAVADGTGEMVLREIGRYTPPGYRERVFYTRKFIDPTGKVWGDKPKLRVMGASGFTRLCKGYRYDVELVTDLADAEIEPEFDLEDFADAASY